MAKTFEINGKQVVWNYECIRDFCPMYKGFRNRNEGLMYFLPEAINEYAKVNGEDVHEIQKLAIYDYEEAGDYDSGLVDYRTGIDCRQVILKALVTGQTPTEEELAAILDVIYIDALPVGVEILANKMYK